MSDQNKIQEKKITAAGAATTKLDGLLDICLTALGNWATERNTAALRADAATLEQLLISGANLDRDIVPVLRKAAQRKNVPILRSWRYFEELIEQRRKYLAADAPSGEPECSQPAFHEQRADQDEQIGSKINETAPSADPQMDELLSRIIKRGPRGI